MTRERPELARSVVMLTPDRQIDRRILLEADSLQSAGWHVTIIAMPSDGGAPDDPRVVRIGDLSATPARENLVLTCYRWLRRRIPMNGFPMRLMKRLAWRYLVDQESFFTRLFYSTASRYAPDVVVAHDLPMLPLARSLAAANGSRLVYDSHELYSEQEFSARERRAWANIEARHIGACDAVITVNQSIASELGKRYGIDHVHVILNAERGDGPISKSDRFHQLFSLAPGARILLLQGGLSAGRNLESLVEAMGHVRDPSVVLVVLGDGLLLRRLQSIARRPALTGRVFFHSAVPQHELLAWTMAADAGVIPYQSICLNNHFCTPNKLFEFIAAGIPMLGSDLPEIRRFVQDGQIGLVGTMDSAASIGALIDSFFGDCPRFEGWRKNLQVTRKTICWEVEQEKLLQIYRGLS